MRIPSLLFLAGLAISFALRAFAQTVETLAAQGLAALFVLGSFFAARRGPKSTTLTPAAQL